MARTDELIPKDFLVHLQTHISGLKEEKPAHQWELARMLWHGNNRRRIHTHHKGAVSFGYQELDKAFGRSGFKAINNRLGFFQKSTNYSKDEGFTFGYWMSDLVREVYDRYMRHSWETETALLRVRGDKVVQAKTLPNAISSTDTNGTAVSTTMWKGAEGLNLVPVDIQSLTRLRVWLASLLDQYDSGAPQPDLLSDPLPDREHSARMHEATVKILRHADTSLAGVGRINQGYALAPSGRLYARGVNLQNVHTEVRQAALHGRWEYDFKNCHFALVRQMAARVGYRCKAIEEYLAKRDETRYLIAAAAGITVEQAKKVLVMTMYGASESNRGEDAIPKEIGKDAAQRLYAVPEYRRLRADIGAARALILEKWPRTANGGLTNASGKAISGKEPATRRLAHLTQGAEAMALLVAVNMHPDQIILLQHDGFTATAQLDLQAIEKAVFEQVGFRLELEEEQLQIDSRVPFLENRSGIEIARKPSTGAGFKESHAS